MLFPKFIWWNKYSTVFVKINKDFDQTNRLPNWQCSSKTVWLMRVTQMMMAVIRLSVIVQRTHRSGNDFTNIELCLTNMRLIISFCLHYFHCECVNHLINWRRKSQASVHLRKNSVLTNLVRLKTKSTQHYENINLLMWTLSKTVLICSNLLCATLDLFSKPMLA